MRIRGLAAMAKSRRSRLPVLERVGLDRPFRFMATGRDGQIVARVHEFRKLTRFQIQRLVFKSGSASYCKERLAQLFHHNYLDRLAYAQGPYGSPQIVYALAGRGADFLVHHKGITREDLDWRPRDNHVEPYFIAHLLKVNDVRVAITVAAREHSWPLKWLDERDLNSRLGKHREGTHPLPDGWFQLDGIPIGDTKLRASFALELDRGTTDRRVWQKKIKSYLRWVASGTYSRELKSRGLRVLTVVADVRRPARGVSQLERRLQALKTWTDSVGGDRRIWFTTSSRLEDEDPLMAGVWSVIGKPDYHGLIDV